MLLGEQKGQSALQNLAISTISTRLDGSLTFLLLPLLPANPILLLLLPHTVELTDFTKELRYCCQTCSYVYKITKKVGLAAVTGCSRLLGDSKTPQRRNTPAATAVLLPAADHQTCQAGAQGG